MASKIGGRAEGLQLKVPLHFSQRKEAPNGGLRAIETTLERASPSKTFNPVI